MTLDEAKRLKAGDRIYYVSSKGTKTTGTFTHMYANQVWAHWDHTTGIGNVVPVKGFMFVDDVKREKKIASKVSPVEEYPESEWI